VNLRIYDTLSYRLVLIDLASPPVAGGDYVDTRVSVSDRRHERAEVGWVMQGTIMPLTFLLSIMFPAGCAVACVLIGRHYMRTCKRYVDYCAEVDERVDVLTYDVQYLREQEARAQVGLASRLPESHGSDDHHRRPNQESGKPAVAYIRTDQYTHINRDCPMGIDIHPADDLVEIVLGENRFGEDTLRLVIDDPDTCLRLTEAFNDARNKLINHLHAKASHNPAMSQLDSQMTARVAN
jgi:hypothetical protein